MNNKKELTTIAKIAERSENMGIGFGSRVTRLMDIKFANEKFNLKLDEFLNADDFDFVHDFCGIQNRIDRQAMKWQDDFFLPRFAGNEAEQRQEVKEEKSIQFYMNRGTGELLNYKDMQKQFEQEYDGNDPTNEIEWDEYYEKVK